MEITENLMVNTQKHIIDKVKTIVKHHKQLTEAKGELFNIYNILNLKNNEVRTHSAFIAELLNVHGTHLMKDAFLNAFLKELPEEFSNHLNRETVTVSVEYFIGLINKKNKSGGRIDIYLKDNFGKTICIENKIDAEDQSEQIQRYCNHNQEKNKVIYLSKFGKDPSVSSRGNLISNFDYHNISYNKNLIKWLDACQALSFDQPILRESIKQYRILIQKITNTLGDSENEDLKQLVVNNLEESSLIATKYQQVVYEIRNAFRNQIKINLTNSLEDFEVALQKDVESARSRIKIEKRDSKSVRWFSVESFSGSGYVDGDMLIGLYAENSLDNETSYNRINNRLVHHQLLCYGHEGLKANLSDNSFLQRLNKNKFLELDAKEITRQIIVFVNENKFLLDK